MTSSTSSPKATSLGSRTAWLLPLRKVRVRTTVIRAPHDLDILVYTTLPRDSRCCPGSRHMRRRCLWRRRVWRSRRPDGDWTRRHHNPDPEGRGSVDRIACIIGSARARACWRKPGCTCCWPSNPSLFRRSRRHLRSVRSPPGRHASAGRGGRNTRTSTALKSFANGRGFDLDACRLALIAFPLAAVRQDLPDRIVPASVDDVVARAADAAPAYFRFCFRAM